MHTSWTGRIYFLCQGTTKTGKPRYYFAREQKGQPVDELPAGYEISESINGIVSLAKARPQLITPQEVSIVEKALRRHPKRDNYRTNIKHDRIEIYELVGPDVDHLMEAFAGFLPSRPGLKERLIEEREQHRQFIKMTVSM